MLYEVITQLSPEQLSSFGRRMLRRHGNGDYWLGCNLNSVPHSQFERRIVLLDTERRIIFASGTPPDNLNYTELHQEQKTIGYLGLMPRKVLADANQLRFVRDQRLVMALIAGLALVISVLLALPVAGRMVRPIRTSYNFV